MKMVNQWKFNSLLLKMAIEIVDFPMKNGGSFHSYVKLPEGKPMENTENDHRFNCFNAEKNLPYHGFMVSMKNHT